MDDNSTDSNNSNSSSREGEDEPLRTLPTPAIGVEVEEPADQDGLNAAAADDATAYEASIRTTAVRFTTLEVREYALCIGDNPGAMSGPPISLDWQWYTGEGEGEDPGVRVLDLEQWEAYRGRRRTLQEMCRGERRRFDILHKEWGYTMQQIRTATRPVNIARAQRRRTRDSSNGDLCNLNYLCKKLNYLCKKTLNYLDKCLFDKLRFFTEKVGRFFCCCRCGQQVQGKGIDGVGPRHAQRDKVIGDSSCPEKAISRTKDSLTNVFAVQEAATAATPPSHGLQ